MSIRETIERAGDPSRPKKSPAHLLLLPVAFGIMGACGYALVVLACALASLSSKEVHGLSGYGETAKILIVLPLLLASLPVCFLVTNLVIWSIPLLRRFFIREAHRRRNGRFSESIRDLLVFSKYWMPPLLAIGFGAALFGR